MLLVLTLVIVRMECIHVGITLLGRIMHGLLLWIVFLWQRLLIVIVIRGRIALRSPAIVYIWAAASMHWVREALSVRLMNAKWLNKNGNSHCMRYRWSSRRISHHRIVCNNFWVLWFTYFWFDIGFCILPRIVNIVKFFVAVVFESAHVILVQFV